MGVSADITAQKQAEAALQESEARLSSAIDVASLGFYELGGDNRVAYLDNRARAFFGILPDQDHLLFDYWKERLHPDDRKRIIDVVQGIATGRLDRITSEYRYQHPEHGTIWLHHLVHTFEAQRCRRADTEDWRFAGHHCAQECRGGIGATPSATLARGSGGACRNRHGIAGARVEPAADRDPQ